MTGCYKYQIHFLEVIAIFEVHQVGFNHHFKRLEVKTGKKRFVIMSKSKSTSSINSIQYDSVRSNYYICNKLIKKKGNFDFKGGSGALERVK